MHQKHLMTQDVKRLPSRIWIPMAVLLLSGMFAVSSPVSAQEADTTSHSWISFRGDEQRTGSRQDTLGAIPNLLWQYTSTDAPQPLFAAPVVAAIGGKQRIFFAAGDKVYCLESDTGSAVWTTPPLSSTIASPLLLRSGANGDVLYCITASGYLLSLDPISGKTLQSLSLGATVQNVAPVPVKTSNGERFVIGTVSGKLIAVDPQKMTLDPSWNVTIGRFGAAVTSTPALTTNGKYLYVPAQDSNIYVVDVMKGTVYYPINLRYSAVSSPAIAGDSVLVTNGPLITCLRSDNGQTRWAINLGGLMQTSPAVSVNVDGSGIVYVGTSTGTFYALDLRDGKKLWQADLGDAVTGSPTALQDMILVATQRGMIFGLDPLDKGHIKWRFRLNTERKVSASTRFGNFGGSGDPRGFNGGNVGNNRFGDQVTVYPISTAPTVVEGKIYVGGDNLAIYAFDTQPFDANPPIIQDFKPYVNNTNNELQDVSNSRSIPGKPPVILKGKLEDDGSGVDPGSIKVLLNDQVIPDASHTYNSITGDLEIRLTGTGGQADNALKDGRITVEVQATDYLGNKFNGGDNKITLNVDNNLAAPEPTRSFNQPGDGSGGGWGRRGGNGRRGGR